MEKQSDKNKYEEKEEIFRTHPEFRNDENKNISSVLKILEQIILINKICVGAFVFIIFLLIVLLYLQGKPLNNDSYNQNIEYFINENKKNSKQNDEIEKLLRSLINIQKKDTIVIGEDK